MGKACSKAFDGTGAWRFQGVVNHLVYWEQRPCVLGGGIWGYFVCGREPTKVVKQGITLLTWLPREVSLAAL